MTKRRRDATSTFIQQALDRWWADTDRALKGRTPAETVADVVATRAEARAYLAEREAAAHGTEACFTRRPPHRRARGKSRRSLTLIEAAKTILADIQPATVRAVCYQLFITMRLIGSMAKGETNRVSTHLTWARETGAIPWEWIVDETRAPERVNAWENPAAYVDTVKRSYRRDRWVDQPKRIEVWSEKGTIRGTLAPVLDAYGVTLRVMHGYGSATAVYQAAQESRHDERGLTVLYVGDYDPSGLHMSDVDLPRRIEQYGGAVDLIRVALTQQDTQSGLPFFATETKRRDPRHDWYLERHGRRCWELDALNPVTLRQRVEQAICDRLDREAWQRAAATEQAECESIATILQAWPGVGPPQSISGPASK